jgi:hypothetical protein
MSWGWQAEKSSIKSQEPFVMLKRIVCLALLSGATWLVVLPIASAAAAPSPWWQVLTGSRPTNLWKPADNVQELTLEVGEAEGFQGAAAEIEVDGKVVGCLGTNNFLGSFLCAILTGFPVTDSASGFEAILETAFGTSSVEVTGGPVGVDGFKIIAPGRSVPTVVLSGDSPHQPFVGVEKSKLLSAGGSGRLALIFTNLGDAAVDGTTTPVTIVDELPEGVEATRVEGFAGAQGNAGPVDCAIDASDLISCSYGGVLPPFEAIEVEVFVSLTGDPPAAGAPGKVSISGGNAPAAAGVQAIKVSSDRSPFGIETFFAQAENEGGGITAHAGGHPFQFTTTIQLNTGPLNPGGTRRDTTIQQPAIPRNLRFSLPEGLVGNATAVPTCDMTTFFEGVVPQNGCAPETAVGVAAVTAIEQLHLGLTRAAVPVFNLPPAHGEPARLGFTFRGAPVVIDTAVDPDHGYRIIASVNNATQLADFLSSTVTLWGVPGDPRHDNARGWECVYTVEDVGPCERPSTLAENAFLRNPVSCFFPQQQGVELEPWNVAIGSVVETASFVGNPPVGCNQVPFDPGVSSSATSKLAGNASGFDFRLDMPNAGLLDGPAIAEAQAKKVEVTLPEGMTINPSQGEGLVGCSPADLARETADSKPGEGCPEASKIGEVQISTPLLEEEAHGSLYVASPHDNPFESLLALYMVAKIPERGILVRQAGKVEPDPITGQLTSTFDNLPQIPFDSFKLHFREGGRAPLVTPPACGNYEVVTRFVPWSAANPDAPAPQEIVTRASGFEIERGVDGGACPGGGQPPFNPGLSAGTINNAAKSYSPFNVRLTRKDGEQEFTNFSIKLPPGVVGKLAGIPFCSDLAIAAAKARTGRNGAQEELDSPSCPASSQIGRTLVGAGVGTSLTYVPGRVYLAGPYNGSALSIVAITAAKVGPFDIGTVVIREALKINPETAEVFIDPTGSDPIPHIIQGIPVHARDIRVYVDRPEFMLNPTNCKRTSTASTVLGSGLDFGSRADDQPVTVTSPFQAADCVSLGFKPKLTLRLMGGMKRGDNPKIQAIVRARPGDANLERAQVTLPHSEFLDNAHIKTVCTRVQFAAGDVPGERCPKGSIYGYAKAFTPLLDEPIQGPVFLRSSSHPLPDLVAALHNDKININVDGRIDSVKGGRIRNTFEALPDAPLTKFVLTMQGGKKGLLINSTNLCRHKRRAIVAFDGQNGKVRDFNPVVKPQCKKRKKHKHRAR